MSPEPIQPKAPPKKSICIFIFLKPVFSPKLAEAFGCFLQLTAALGMHAHLMRERFARAVQQTSATAAEAESDEHCAVVRCSLFICSDTGALCTWWVQKYVYTHMSIHTYIYMRVYYSIESGYIRFQFLARRVPRQSAFRYWGHQISNFQKMKIFLRVLIAKSQTKKRKRKGKNSRQIDMYILVVSVNR
jgi:L-asparagine transporter-like permease